MAVDKDRGYFAVVTTMLTLHVFRMHGVTLDAIRSAASAAKAGGLVTGKIPVVSTAPSTARGEAFVVPVAACRLGMQRGNVRVENLPSDLR